MILPINNLQNPYMVTFFISIMSTVSFLSGSPWHFVLTGVFLVFFVTYCSINYWRSDVALFAHLKQHHPLMTWLVIAFVLSSLISLLKVICSDVALAQKMAQSLKYCYYVLMFVFCFCLAWFAAINQLTHQKIYLAFAFGVWGLLLSLWLLYLFFDAPNYAKWGDVPPVGGNIRLIAMSISIAITVILAQILFAQNSRFMRAILYLSLFAFMAFLTWSGSRASSIGTVVLLLFLVGLKAKFDKIDYAQLLFIVALCLVAIVVGYYLPVVGGGGLDHFAAKFEVDPGDVVLSNNHIVKVGNGRIEAWSSVLGVVRDYPLFGLASYGYFFYPPAPYHTDHVHNIFLQFLVEWGLIGACLLIAIIALALKQLFKGLANAVMQRDLSLIMTTSVLCLLTLNGLTDGTYSALLPVFLVVIGYSFLLVKPIQQCLNNR